MGAHFNAIFMPNPNAKPCQSLGRVVRPDM